LRADTSGAARCFASLDHDPVGMSAAEFGAFVRKLLTDYARVIRDANIKAQ
jgi:hypothetical protein